jgi:hypothetical protein
VIKDETYTRTGRGEENQATKICGSLVAESASGIDESSNTICLDTRAYDGRSPTSRSSRGLLGLEELFLAISLFGALEGVTEDRCEHGSGGDLAEEDAEGDGRRLNGR